MDFMSACCVLVVQLLVLAIGGIRRGTWGLPS